MTAGIKANADGSAAIQVGGSDAITITSALNTTFAGTANVATGALYPIVSGTSVSASGTSVNFTGIPSWVKRITVMFNGVSTSGTSPVQIQIGSGSITNSGYSGSCSYGTTTTNSSGFVVHSNIAAATIAYGTVILTNVSGNVWTEMGSIGAASNAVSVSGGGLTTLTGALDRVRITTVNGTDTFDAGTINILYE